jgi:hypothetical protein
MTKITVAFRNFTNAPKNSRRILLQQNDTSIAHIPADLNLQTVTALLMCVETVLVSIN